MLQRTLACIALVAGSLLSPAAKTTTLPEEVTETP